jgi:HlyD family secretion protein
MSADKQSSLFLKPAGRWSIFLAALVALTTGFISFLSLLLFRSNFQTQPQKPAKTAPVRVAVTALGRIVPEGEVTQLSAPSSLSGVRVEKLLVKQGQQVKTGQVIALLEGYARSLANVQQALTNVEVARAKLAQVKAGAKLGDIEAQKATIANLESQLQGEIASQQAAIASLQAQSDNAQTENTDISSCTEKALFPLPLQPAKLYNSKRYDNSFWKPKQLSTARSQLCNNKSNKQKPNWKVFKKYVPQMCNLLKPNLKAPYPPSNKQKQNMI